VRRLTDVAPPRSTSTYARRVRVQFNVAGQLELELMAPWRDGTTHLLMLPLKFMHRRIEWRLLGSQICERYGSYGSVRPVRWRWKQSLTSLVANSPSHPSC